MKRTTGSNNINNRFVDGPPGTTIDASWLNNVQEEIASVIEEADLILDGSNYGQLLLALNTLYQSAVDTEFKKKITITITNIWYGGIDFEDSVEGLRWGITLGGVAATFWGKDQFSIDHDDGIISADYFKFTPTGNTVPGMIAIGRATLDTQTTSETTGAHNIAIGYYAGNKITTGSYNVAMGYEALLNNTTGDKNCAVGYKALRVCTTGGNTAVGDEALTDNTTGYYNTAVGVDALASNTNGNGNTAVGRGCLPNNQTGDYNTGVGGLCLYKNTTGQNTAVGYNALYDNTTGSYLVAIGYDALANNTTGDKNCAVGYQAGITITTGSNNTLFGYNTDVSAAAAAGQIVIGDSLTGTANSRVHIGDNGSHIYNNYNVNATWTHSSDERMKKDFKPFMLGLDFIKMIQPMLFKLKPQSEYPKEWTSYDPEKTTPPYDGYVDGIVAQQVKKALERCGQDVFSGWDVLPDGKQQISTEAFVYPLINAVNELADRLEKLENKKAA